jgi:hypothetical protein
MGAGRHAQHAKDRTCHQNELYKSQFTSPDFRLSSQAFAFLTHLNPERLLAAVAQNRTANCSALKQTIAAHAPEWLDFARHFFSLRAVI